jgi:hypothetical protein
VYCTYCIKELGLKISTEKTEYKLKAYHQNAGDNYKATTDAMEILQSLGVCKQQLTSHSYEDYGL